jgi:hypothetical protein
MDMFVHTHGDRAKAYATWYVGEHGHEHGHEHDENEGDDAATLYAKRVTLAAARAFGRAHCWEECPGTIFELVEFVR